MTPIGVKTIDLEAQKRRKKLSRVEQFPGEVPPAIEPRITEIERLLVEPMPQQERIPLELELEKLRPTPIEKPELELPEPTVEDLIGKIYEDLQPLTLQFIEEWATTEPEAFLTDLISNRGRTPDTVAMLELFGATPELIKEIFKPVPPPEPLKIPEGGYKFTQEVEGIERLFTIDKDYLVKMEETLIGKYDPERGGIVPWGIQQTVVPVDGIRKLVTITNDNRAYDENNKFLGTYNPVTLEIDKVSTIDKASEVWDALIFGSRQMWELGENFFMSALPNLVFQDTPAHQRAVYGDEFSDRVDAISQSIRDKFRSAYAGNKAEFEDWVEKNPNLQPRLDYAEGVTEHIDLLADPFYWMYEFANIAPFCAAVMVSAITAGALTGGNPLAVITGGAAVVYPVETQAVMEALLANGADEQQAAKIATPAGVIIASLESLGRLPLLNAILPQIMRIFKREAGEELGKLAARELLKKGIKTAVSTELAEVITEVLQEATQNAAVKIINENQSIFENLDVIAAKTAVATAPLSLFGGYASMRRVAPSETERFTDAELEALGYFKEPKSDAWYQPLEVTRRGVKPVEPKPEVPAPKPTTQQIWDTMEVSDRVVWAKQAKLEGKLGSKAWADLTREQQDELLLAREELAPPVAEVTGEQIAQETGLRYDGIQEGIGMQFTDVEQTGTTFYAQSLAEAERKLAEKRKLFAEEVKPQAPQVTREIETLISDLQAQIEKTSEELKGLRGEEARISREAIGGLKREVTYAQKTLEAFREQINVPEATVLRSTIAAMSKFKGLPKKQLQDIIRDVAGTRQLRNVASPQLMEILEKVREARPVRIKGEKVVTPKTEAKIQSLKESLISSRQMTNEIYNHLMERLNLNTDRYEHANKFITETEAKDLIRSMNDEVVLAEWDIKVQDGLAKHPDIKEVRDRLNERGMEGTGVAFDGKPIPAEIKRRWGFASMRYYTLNLQKKLKAPIYDTWQKINMAHLVVRDKHNQQLRRLQETTPNFKEIAADEVALKRIEDYIASKHNLAKIKAPELTEDEMAIATELERGYFEAENDVRFIRFTNAYAENEGDIDLIAKEIPSAPKAALRRAIDIYEGKGANELRRFTDTQKWGVIKTGYDPRSFIKPELYYRAPKETIFAKGLLRTRTGIEYEVEDTNIIHRYSRHQKQLIALQELSSLVRAFGRLYAEHAHKLAPQTQRKTSKDLAKGINEMKGYREDGGDIIHLTERLYGQVAATVFWRPDLVARNKFQNFAFNPDFWALRFLDPRNKPLTESRRRWFEVFVSQERVFQYDFLMYGEKPFRGFGRLTRWARRTSLYPWSDKSNRAEADMVRINRVDRALDVFEKDGDVQKLVDKSGLNEFEPRQQAEALELLAMDSVDYGIDGMEAVSGREAFALYNAQQLVNNVHFLYDRAQRAPAEMGATGKTLGNILVFNRSWAERFILQARKLAPDSKATTQEKMKAVTVIVGVITAGLLAGEAYKEVTGKEHSPYNPLNIITWTPGGLALGVTEDISNVIYLMTRAVEGDKNAFASLPGVIAAAATLTLPFYKNAVQAFDAITDMKGIDVWAMRKIREMIDEEYEVRGGVHEVERTLLEKLQRAIFSFKDQPETPQEKIEESESMLGMDIDVGDLAFTLEEPDIHDMRKLNTDLSRILKNVKPEEITKENGYSELAVAWLEKESYEATWNTLPHKKIYEITELPEELAKWANRNLRKLGLVAQYQKLEGAEAKAFLDAHAELRENPGIEWLKRWPIANAQLALWGQTKIYSMEAYDEFNRLVRELDIPDDAIPELTLPPKGSVENYFKYQDMLTEFAPNSWEVQYLMTQDDELRKFLQRNAVETPMRSLELKIKHRPLYEQYDLLETDEERAQLKAANPEWVDDMRRIEAIENAAPVEIVGGWVERGRHIDKFGAGSSEVMVWLLDHPEVHKWALEKTLLTDDGTDWNEPVLRINAEWREQDEAFDAIDGEDQEARQAYLAENEEYRKDRRRREAYGDGFREELIENFVAYWELPVKGYEQERYLIAHPELATAMGIDLPEKAPSEKLDILLKKEKPTPEDELRMTAYKLYVPDKHIEDYVKYYSLEKPDNLKEKTGTDLWYEDDWWMQEHSSFYKDVYLGIRENQRKDYTTVPTREVFDKYLQYLKEDLGNARERFRLENLDLDEWLVLKFGYTSILDREKLPEKVEEPEDEVAEKTRELEEKLRKLKK